MANDNNEQPQGQPLIWQEPPPEMFRLSGDRKTLTANWDRLREITEEVQARPAIVTPEPHEAVAVALYLAYCAGMTQPKAKRGK